MGNDKRLFKRYPEGRRPEDSRRFIFTMDRQEFVRLSAVCAELDIKIAQFLRSLIRKELKEILGEENGD